jgi:hypothetical protein
MLRVFIFTLSVLSLIDSFAVSAAESASQPTTRAVTTPELQAAMDRLEASIPADVREGRREPNDRERMTAHFALSLE